VGRIFYVFKKSVLRDVEVQSEQIEPYDVGNIDGTLDLSRVPKERVDIYKALLLSTCFTASSAGTIMLTGWRKIF
jgi:hypothetical protein